MNDYDDMPPVVLTEAKPRTKYIHTYKRESSEVITEYSEDLCELIIEYGRQGKSIEGFCGAYNISIDSMTKWIDTDDPLSQPDFKEALKIAISACIDYWDGQLIHELQQDVLDAPRISLLRIMKQDSTKYMPNSLRNILFEGVRNRTPEQINDANNLRDNEERERMLKGV